MNERQLVHLITQAREGTISPNDFRSLEQVLRSDPDARETYVRLVQVESLLELCPPNSPPAEVEGGNRPRFPLRIVAWCAAAAAIAVAATIGVQSAMREPDNSPVARAAVVPIATLIFAEGCDWVRSGQAPTEGERLEPGQIGIRSGTAVIRFDGGAELLIRGRSDVALHTAGSGEVLRGEVVVRAVDGAEGFTLATPRGEVVDLGTEFAVKVEASGDSEVHVLDGEVSYGDRANQKVLRAGQALRFEKAGSAPLAVAVDAPRFAEAVRSAGPRPRADLMKVYEGFNYPEGTRKITACTGGKGWAAPWRLRREDERALPGGENAPPTMSIVHGEMNVTWPVAGGRQGMLEFPAGRQTILVRELQRPLAMDLDTVTYFSLMVRETVAPESGSERRFDAMRLTLRSSRDYFGPSVSFGYASDSRPRVQTGPGVGFTSPTLAPRGQSSLWVGKIVSRAAGEDEIYFRIYGEDEQLDYAEPAVWHVVTRGVAQSANLDRLLLTSNGPSLRIVDELRIGPSWRSVAPLPLLD